MRSFSKRSILAAASLGLALTAGCTGTLPAPVVQETTGELSNAVFRWDCIDASDPTCGTGVFPTTLALGSRFGLEVFRGHDLPNDLGALTLEPASPQSLAQELRSFTALRPGDISVVALGDGYAVDYITLSVRAVDDLILGEYEAPDFMEVCDDDDLDGVCDGTGGIPSDLPVTLAVGDTSTLRVRAFGGGTDLAGALPYTWESLTPERLSITSAGGRSADVVAKATGLVQISVRAGEYTEVFEFEVDDPPEPEPTDTEGSGDESETGSDTGTGSESGSGSESGTGLESGSGSESGTSGGTDGATTTGGMQ